MKTLFRDKKDNKGDRKMCGIFLCFQKDGCIHKEKMAKLMQNWKMIENRGPDRHTLSLFNNTIFGFHRLAINDTSDKGDQPFDWNGNVLMCNGEIYNYHELCQNESFPLKSKSDCEILLHLFEKYGVDEALQKIDGVFAIVYMTADHIYLIRDKIGVKPIFYTMKETEGIIIASEPIALEGIYDTATLEVLPSSYMIYDKHTETISTTQYHQGIYTTLDIEEEQAIIRTHTLLTYAVQKRMISDRPIGCLLSGGLDSSVIASILQRESTVPIKTFSVGFPDSTDIVYARKVAQFIGSDHHEYIIQYQDALKYIPTIIKKLATYDTTTIRASTPMFMLCEWIDKNFKEKVIFSGEGSDEIFCGYLYSHQAPTPGDLVEDSIRLVNDLYKYDVLRADRCTAENGLEFREPFLDQHLVQFALSLPGELKKPKEFEKDLLRKAFTGYLPDDVLWRRKAAFSDAVSSSSKPWYKWIHEYLGKYSFDIHSYGGTKESDYYKTIFYSYYQNYQPDIPLWLPKWTNTGGEPSATVLSVYNAKEH